MNVLFRFSGQAAYEVDTGRRKQICVVFGMIDEKRESMAWYLFSSPGDAKSKGGLASPRQLAHREVGGHDTPHTFKKDIGLGELASNPKGTAATLTFDEITKTFIEFRIGKLTTKAKEVVTFPFSLRYDSDPSSTDPVEGQVSFLEFARFDRNEFPKGPQGGIGCCSP